MCMKLGVINLIFGHIKHQAYLTRLGAFFTFEFILIVIINKQCFN